MFSCNPSVVNALIRGAQNRGKAAVYMILPLSLLISSALCASGAFGLVLATSDQLHAALVTSSGVHSVMDLILSNNKVKEGDTLTVSLKCSALKNGVSYVQSIDIEILYGEVEVVSVSPAISGGPNAVFEGSSIIKEDYGVLVHWGFTLIKGSNGYEWPRNENRPATDPITYDFDSPTTFTATFLLKKATEVERNGSSSPPCVLAGDVMWGGPDALGTIQYLKTPEDDLSITSVCPIQVVHDPSTIIANKKAALEVQVHSSFTKTVYVDFNVTYDFGTRSYLETGRGGKGVPIMPGDNTVYIAGGPSTPGDTSPWMEPNKGSYLYWTKSGLDDKVKVVVDPKNKVGDTDASNNVFTLSRKVEESKRFSVWVVPIYFPFKSPNPQTGPTVNFSEQINYLMNILPVSEDRFTWTLSVPMTWPGNPVTGNTTRILNWLYYRVAQTLTTMAKANQYNRTVIVVSGLPPFTDEYDGDAIGVFREPVNLAPVIVNLGSLSYNYTTAHEIAHTYFLWHPDGLGPPKANSQRFYVAARNYGAYMANLMLYAKPPRWIDEGRYEKNPQMPLTYVDPKGIAHNTTGWNLMDQFKTGSDPAVIVTRGAFFSNSTVKMDDPWYKVSQGTVDLPLGSKGDYSFVMLNGQGKELGRCGFNTSFTYITEDPKGNLIVAHTDVEPFVLGIPYLEGTASVELRDSSGSVIAKRPVSANSPKVQVTSPSGGEQAPVGGVFTVRWDASDADGDSLTYAVSYSSDGGASWVPLTIDLKQPSYDWNTAGLQGGSYKVLVMANDGFNTVSSTSKTFTLKQPAIGPEAEIKVVFDKTGKPTSGDPKDLALAFDYVEFLDSSQNIVAKLDIGTGDTGVGYTGRGFYQNQANWDGVETYIWAGGADKTAYLFLQKPPSAKYLRMNVRPFMENNPTKIYVDGVLLSTIMPTRGWKEYTVTLTKAKATLTCTASSTKTNPGETVTLSGSVTPVISGASVSLVITSPSGHIDTVPLTTDANGGYSYSFKPIDKGEWGVQATWPGSEGYLNETSPRASWSVAESTPQGSGGVPAYPFEALALGVAVALIILIKRSQSSPKQLT